MIVRTISFVAVLFVAEAAAASIQFDGEFFDADWTMFVDATGVGRTFVGGQRSTNPNVPGGLIDGRPGAYRYSTQVHGGLRSQNMTVRLSHIFQPYTYDPALGPLTTLDVSFDGYLFGNSDGLPSFSHPGRFGVALRQNGNTFFHDAGLHSGFRGYDQWNSFQFPGLTESDFQFAGRPRVPLPQLDFSVNGAPIQFGYFTYTEQWFTAQARHGVDNWRLEVNPQANASVPEPSTATILLGLLCTAAVRFGAKRRRQLARLRPGTE